MTQKLTKKAVDGLELPENGQQLVWDSELKGFGLRLTPKNATYIVQGRTNGKTRRVTIGKHGVYTADQARKKALKILQDLSNNIDPAAEKRKQKAESVTLEKIVEEYIQDRNLKDVSQQNIIRHLNNIFSDWKKKPVVKITRDLVLERFREKSKQSKAQANQAFRVLRAVLNYARATYRPYDKPILPENPCQILSDAKMWHNIQAKNRRIPTDKVGLAWNALQEVRASPGQTESSRATADALLFTLLTGGRWGEVSELTWNRVDMKNATWYLPDPKNKQPVTLPLSQQAKQIIEERPRKNEFVFATSRSKSGHVSDYRHILNTVINRCGISISVHDLRRTFRDVTAECGIELWRCKLLLNHKLNDDVTLGSYTETSDLRYLNEDAQKIADWIERQGKIAANEKVVDINKAKEQ